MLHGQILFALGPRDISSPSSFGSASQVYQQVARLVLVTWRFPPPSLAPLLSAPPLLPWVLASRTCSAASRFTKRLSQLSALPKLLLVACSSLDKTEQKLEASANKAFGIDPAEGLPHKRELGKLTQAVKLARVQTETKAHEHGRPVRRSQESVERPHAKIHGTVWIRHPYLPNHTSRLLKKSWLTGVVSLAEMGLNLDSTTTIQTKAQVLVEDACYHRGPT